MTSIQILVLSPYLDCTRYCFFHRTPPATRCLSPQRGRIGNFHWNGCLLRVPVEKNLFRVATFAKDGISTEKGRRASLLVVRAKDGFNSDDGWWEKSNLSTVLGNLVLAIGLTYLIVTGQLGWLLDALVSIWLLAALLPIVGLGAFFWFAGRDIVQSSCPNCGNSFQIFKSAMKDGVHFCPFCTQPFTVQGNKFERESSKFSSKRSAAAKQVFHGPSPRYEEVVDIEAEVMDIE